MVWPQSLAAAKIAAWSGVETTIAQSDRPNILRDVISGEASIGTVFRARNQRLPARKLWIAFAVPASGRIVVDQGARRALESDQRSLLAAGVIKAEGEFSGESAVELVDENDMVFAKGLTRWDNEQICTFAGTTTKNLPEDLPEEVVHRDDLVILPA